MGSETKLPINFGVLLYPGFQALDVFGPLDALNLLSQTHRMNLYVLAATRDAVSTRVSDEVNVAKSIFHEEIVPTHTFDEVPQPLDVLLIPGGFGLRPPADLSREIEFVKNAYPHLQHLITVCTGSTVAARAGVLDGKKATSNKASWAFATASGGKTHWVAKARWIRDGNVWTSSGVSAGIDVMFAWIEEVFGEETANRIANRSEYERKTDAHWDPFADIYGAEDVLPSE